MNTASTTHSIIEGAAEIDADTLAPIEKLTTSKPLDEQAYRRIRERADRLTEELRQEKGVREIAVGLVRESRDER